MVTIPSQKVYDEIFVRNSSNAFGFDFDLFGVLILYLKLSPKLIVSIINGVPIELVFRNNNIKKNSIMLYIKDIIDAPYYIEKDSIFENSINSNLSPSIDEFYTYSLNYKKIRIAIFDYSIKHIYSEDVDFIVPDENILQWHERTRLLSYTPPFDFAVQKEDSNTGYIVKIACMSIVKTATYSNIQFKKGWMDNSPYIVSTNKYDDKFDIINYLQSGRLGYFQEQTLKELLSSYFEPNINLFSSVKLLNKTELTDFVVLFNNVTVLIESKTDSAFSSHPDRIGSKEKAITSSINKATKQLIKAIDVLEHNIDFIDNENFAKIYNRKNRFVRICLVSESLLINEKSLTTSLSEFDRKDIPMIMDIATFIEMLRSIREKGRIIQCILRTQSEIKQFGGLPIVSGYK